MIESFSFGGEREDISIGEENGSTPYKKNYNEIR